MESFEFPSNFTWSVATASYQIEGAASEDGRGPSIWDTFSKAGKCQNDTGDVACDSYHNWKRDIEMIKELGVHQYRLSLSWSRLLPDGTLKKINQKGVEYYKKLIAGLIEAGIEPMITIFHWDLPQSLQDRGGFLNPQIVSQFADYSKFCFETFGDQVKTWTTFNEPVIFTLLGHTGYPLEHAPGGFKDYAEWTLYLSAHHILLAHAKAVKIYRKLNQGGKIGIVLVTGHFYPATNSEEDEIAARNQKEFFVGLYTNPVIYGDYPDIVKERVWKISKEQGRVTSRLPEFTKEEMEDLKGSVDFVGINYYFSFRIGALKGEEKDVFRGNIREVDVGGKFIEWMFNHPSGLQTSLAQFKKDYGDIPIMITENGMKDPKTQKSDLEDYERIDFIKEHLISLWKAINENKVNVIGYTAWSLMDNFEWAKGYNDRFGLYRVDFNDPKRTRTPKKSAYFYKDVIANNRVQGTKSDSILSNL
ncbi:hypothetical protein FO519_008774 [Halicephalobus sp. NKZ332]|nr:hypothetical protein FO519_008774 [Halicephalobus sp. NKZ332]